MKVGENIILEIGSNGFWVEDTARGTYHFFPKTTLVVQGVEEEKGDYIEFKLCITEGDRKHCFNCGKVRKDHEFLLKRRREQLKTAVQAILFGLSI